jgi:hypothetical protein
MFKTQHLLALGVTLALLMSPAGCGSKKKQAEGPPEPRGNPLAQDPAGGAPAQAPVQRGAQRVVNQDLLRNFGVYYTAYRTEKGAPPRTVDEFRAYLKEDPNARNMVAAIDKGWIVWLLDPPPGGSQILAYEKDEFQLWHNRLVLFADGSVQMMLTADFQAALKRQQ